MTINPSRSVPIYVVCGWLGAGKTTLLVRLLHYWRAHGRRVGVLMNEAGDVSIDGPRAAASCAAVLNLAGGCVCCDAKDDISRGIAQLIADHDADLIVLECSGMADPVEVVDAITEISVSRLAQLKRVITVLHPCEVPESKPIGILLRNMVRYADDIILNKCDLYDEKLVNRFRTAIVCDGRDARLWETTHADLDIGRLLGEPAGRKTRRPIGNVVFGAPQSPSHPRVVTVRLSAPLERERFTDWLEGLPDGVERAKGYVQFTDSSQVHEFQAFPPGSRWIGPVNFSQDPDLAAVLIGRDYDQEVCRAGLLACCSDQSVASRR